MTVSSLIRVKVFFFFIKREREREREKTSVGSWHCGSRFSFFSFGSLHLFFG